MQMGDSGDIVQILAAHFSSAGQQPRLGCELGVHRGETSATLLRAFPSLTLLMVDEWATYSASHAYRQSGDGCARLTQAEQDANMQAAIAATEFAGKRAVILREGTLEAAKSLHLGKQQLCFCFVDADHTLEAVQADIAAYWPLVRSGGVIAFHDVDHPRDRKQIWGVRRAIEEFVAREGLSFQQRGSCAWVVKS